MAKRCFLFFALSVFLSTHAGGQNPRIDSLYDLERNAKDQNTRLDILHRIVSQTWDYNFDKAYQVALREHDLARRSGSTKALVIAQTDLGIYHYLQSNYGEAKRYYRQALATANGKQFGDYPAYTLTRMANLYRVQGAFDSAEVYYRRTELKLEGVPEGTAAGSLYFHWAWLRYDQSRYKEALPLIYRALRIRTPRRNALETSECWRLLGMIHLDLHQYDSSLYYLKKPTDLAAGYAGNALYINCMISLGDFYVARGDLLTGIREYRNALELLNVHDVKRFRALIQHHIGLVFDSQGNYLKAIEYLLSALKLSEEINSRQEMARINTLLGWCNHHLHNYYQARIFARRSMRLAKDIHDKVTEAQVHNLLGNIYFNTHQYDSALLHYDTALLYRRQFELTTLVANTTYNISRVYEVQGRHKEALDLLHVDLAWAEKTDNKANQALTRNAIGLIYGRLDDLKSAEEHLSQGLAIAKQLGSQLYKRDAYINFAKVYTQAGESEKAVYYYEKYILINDSIVNRENLMGSMQMNALYQLDKKEQEVTTLTSENALKQAQIEVQQSDLRFKNFVLLLSVFGILLLVGGGIFLYRYSQEKITANKALEQLNRAVHEQKEEIQAQSEELMEANTILSKLNNDLLEKQEEIEAQSEELREANETIGEINRGLETVVNKRTSQLKEAYKELDTFFYRSSHDFRRPLTTFLGLAEVAKITVKDNYALELFAKVRETAVNLDKMLFKLQSISDLGAQQLVYKEVLIREIYNTIHDSFREELSRKGIRLVCEIDPGESFYSYPAMVRIILENLIENAVNFCVPVAPVIIARASRRDGHMVIEVSDNGPGIEAQYIDHIFDMYFRASERSKGNGLGLYIVKKAAEKLEGTVVVSSVQHVGTVFTVMLPLSSHQLSVNS
jgi:signal transduction histidine kinase